ncbi:hypothetical protein GUITHDRAFT_108193 [Guillardia theta CCMP2712]|nr:hypothetical protein GUITHDRAFT_108193 [Guillardia theta CCMP2712]EKX46162.1 hypothetical protein GUITHDRAFT_108193 [Guillardia theta CCMP2712]|eukprot:XP_005833142.1 hypothetical protein GUITHDRAFT_108193 [Guillardia theta CCMP2712]
MLFFKKMEQTGLSVTYRGPRQTESWDRCLVVNFSSLQGIKTLPAQNTCLRPISAFQGGYDAVMVDKEKRKVMFVQATIAQKHSFKLSFFLKALKALNIPEGGEWKVEVVFLIPVEELARFEIKPIEDSGALKDYGWKRGEEAMQAEVAGISIL